MHTACVWSEKLPFARYSVVKDHSAPGFALRAARSLVGPQRPTPLPRTNFSKTVEPEGRAGVLGAPGEASARQSRALNKVENTGLEPVTSWLQTRRSPS